LSDGRRQETFEERIGRIEHPGKNGKAELQKLSEIITARCSYATMLHARKFPYSCSLLVLRSVSNPTSFAPLRRTNDMKQILAACVAIAVLWVIDVEFNNGRYSAVVQRTFKYILTK
jgi:hypothetical protein